MLTIALAVGLGVLSSLPQQRVPPPVDSALHARATELERRVERLTGTVDALGSQLESERAMNTHALDSIERIATTYTGAIAAVILILGVFGYRDLRETVRRSVQDQLDKRMTDLITGPLDKRLDTHLREWDQRHARVIKRAERFGGPQEGGRNV